MRARRKRNGRLKVGVVLPVAMGLALASVLLVRPWHSTEKFLVPEAPPAPTMYLRAELYERYVAGSDVRASGWARRGTPLLVHVDPQTLSDVWLGRLAIASRVPGAEEPFAAWMVGRATQVEVPVFATSVNRVAEIPDSESWEGTETLELATYRVASDREFSFISEGDLVPLGALRDRQTDWIDVSVDVQRRSEAELRERVAEAMGVADALRGGRVLIAWSTDEFASPRYVAMAQQQVIATASTIPVACVYILRGRQPIAYFDIRGYVDPKYEWALWHEVHVLEGQTLDDASKLSAELVVTEAMLEQAIDQPGTWVGRAPIGTVKVLPKQ